MNLIILIIMYIVFVFLLVFFIDVSEDITTFNWIQIWLMIIVITLIGTSILIELGIVNC